jgi:hypothetical protein
MIGETIGMIIICVAIIVVISLYPVLYWYENRQMKKQLENPKPSKEELHDLRLIANGGKD